MRNVESIISELEEQKAAIDRAIAALREVSGSRAGSYLSVKNSRPAVRKRRLSAEGRKRIVEATKKRWAENRAAKQSALLTKKAPVARKRTASVTKPAASKAVV